MTIIYSSMLTSIMFINTNHPMIMGLILLLQTILIMLITGMMSQTFWFSYILFLIFIGGMLILFIYVTSLASNEMASLSKKTMLTMLTFTVIMILTMSFIKLYLNSQDNSTFINFNNPSTNQILKLYNMPTHLIIILLGSYLFLSLIAVVKVTNIFKGPLRKMN
uniref:NADH dehydrogenase subunit 6 n=1 Tax=Margattea bisignata TaxID=1928774 RepID=UPI0027A5AB09|nr:NADH dehydrogenase subunit 6 [Margattea bisignata]WGO57376.1 NADH dehydrogenase subunit 6 [Margattea bisignata]